MRIGGFMMGAMLGAAAAVYINRKGMPMIFSMGQGGKGINSLMNKSKSGMQQQSHADGKAASSSGGSNRSRNGQHSNHESIMQDAGLDQVEHIVNEDPQLKSQVNDIMSEGGTKTKH